MPGVSDVRWEPMTEVGRLGLRLLEKSDGFRVERL